MTTTKATTTRKQEDTFEAVGERLQARYDFEDTDKGWVATSKGSKSKTIRQRINETDDQFMARLDDRRHDAKRKALRNVTIDSLKRMFVNADECETRGFTHQQIVDELKRRGVGISFTFMKMEW